MEVFQCGKALYVVHFIVCLAVKKVHLQTGVQSA